MSPTLFHVVYLKILFLLFFIRFADSKDIKVVSNSLACGFEQPLIVTDKQGFLTSPQFDNFNYYPANQNCSWTLIAPKDKIFILRKMYFALNLECSSDFLYVFDGAPPHHTKIGSFCGYWMPLLYTSKSHQLHLNFVSGRTPRDVGFRFYFQQVKPIVVCGEDKIMCRHRTKCLSLDKKCDGVDNCGDGTDEENCGFVNKTGCGIPSVKPVLDSWRIVGGRDAVPGSWPWQASLRLLANEPFSHFCGGVLIERQWILTAAHCFKNDNLDVTKWSVLMGKHFRLIPEDTEQVRYMESIFIHPDYKGFEQTKLSIPWLLRKQHDLALVKLNAPVSLKDYVSPVCLPPQNTTLPTGTLCYVTGWGETYGTGAELELKQASVPIVSLELCRKWHRFFDVAPSMVCAGHADGGHDSCQGDSGGPLVYSDDKETWRLAGIVSTGGSICADKEQPGIYTLVPYYVDWIEDTIHENTEHDMEINNA